MEEDFENSFEYSPTYLVGEIDRHFQCEYCQSDLQFMHSTDFSKNLTIETALCEICGKKNKNRLHALN